MNKHLPELISIITIGGLSTRMGKDKSTIDYHGKPQRYFLYDLLKTFTDKVFISCNESQAISIQSGYEFIVDKTEYAGHGPVSGLLSVFAEYPHSSVLLIGCDYPYLNPETIKKLIDNRNSKYAAVSYQNNETKIIEPLITLYENSSRELLLARLNTDKFSLREFLELNNSYILKPNNDIFLKSVDTIDEYNKSKKEIHVVNN